MKIINAENKLLVYTPYNPIFVKKIKQIIGAKWDPDKKAWSAPESALENIRSIMMSVYGESDVFPAEKVDVKLTYHEEYCEERQAVFFAGKTIAMAFGRDSGAKISPEVCFLAGGATSGGSTKHWETVIKKGSVVQIPAVPLVLVQQEMENLSSDSMTVEIIKKDSQIEALNAEKEALEKRLAEINAILQKGDKK